MVASQSPGEYPLTASLPARLHKSCTVYCLLFTVYCLLLTACGQTPPALVNRDPVQVTIRADDQTTDITTEATTVREAVAEADLTLNEADEITPPPFTPLEDGMAITIVRITESLETLLRNVPFEIKIVRSDALGENDPPVIVQGGKPGLIEETVRIVYRDGLESERWVTQTTEIEAAQDEIRMVGIGAIRGNVEFPGILAFRSGGAAVVLRGNTVVPEQLAVGGTLDGRIFTLSPTGSHLLYTISESDSSFSNSLWLIGTGRGEQPQPLGVENVLWADWNPAQPDQIAYTTADTTNLPPGWEANNDLWLATIPANSLADFEPALLIDTYPATYGWWGGNYAWAPDGKAIAYSYADEVGLIDLEAEPESDPHRPLQRFTDFNTLADWVWLPTLTWSPDGRFIAFTNHNSDDATEQKFDSWLVDTITGASGRIVPEAGMWSHLHWSPVGGTPYTNTTTLSYTIPITEPIADSQIAFLKTTDPQDSQRSPYVLWLMDRDGSNSRRLYPEPGENALFPRDQRFMAWSPDGRFIAFIYNQTLYLYNIITNEVTTVTQDDAAAAYPTWAPYGIGKLIQSTADPIPSEDILVPPDISPADNSSLE